MRKNIFSIKILTKNIVLRKWLSYNPKDGHMKKEISSKPDGPGEKQGFPELHRVG